MIVIPAIDLKEGKCVRLEQGLMEKDTVFCDNPAEQACEWAGRERNCSISSILTAPLPACRKTGKP